MLSVTSNLNSSVKNQNGNGGGNNFDNFSALLCLDNLVMRNIIFNIYIFLLIAQRQLQKMTISFISNLQEKRKSWEVSKGNT